MEPEAQIKTIRLLMIEDSADDAFINKKLLADKVHNAFYQTKFEVKHVERLLTGIELSKHETFDVILLDFELPDGSGMDLVNRIRDHKITTPIVVLTGYDYAQTAVEALRKGAQDYLSKEEVTSKNLIRTLCYAIERQKLQNELSEAYERINTLHGMLPICCKCKQIRDDEGYWHQLESYMSSHAEIRFSHGYCPVCYEETMKEFENTERLLQGVVFKSNSDLHS